MTDTPPGMASSWVDLSREIVAAGYMSPISPRRLTPSAGGGMPFGSETDYMRMLRQEAGGEIWHILWALSGNICFGSGTTIELTKKEKYKYKILQPEPDTDDCSRSEQARKSGSGFSAKFSDHWCLVPYPYIRIMLGHILSCSIKKPASGYGTLFS